MQDAARAAEKVRADGTRTWRFRAENVRDFAFAFYGDMTSAGDAGGRAALAEFEAELEAQAVALEILPGTMVIISNRVAAHGRGSFEAGFTPVGLPYRWLQRVFWTGHIERFEIMTRRCWRSILSLLRRMIRCSPSMQRCLLTITHYYVVEILLI